MSITPNQKCLKRLRVLYRDAFKVPLESISNDVAVEWAARPELWAEHQIRYRGYTFYAAEAVVRQCRILHKRAAIAATELAAVAAAEARGEDRYDPLLPCIDGSCSLAQDAAE